VKAKIEKKNFAIIEFAKKKLQQSEFLASIVISVLLFIIIFHSNLSILNTCI
jgi:hypothetical protein